MSRAIAGSAGQREDAFAGRVQISGRSETRRCGKVERNLKFKFLVTRGANKKQNVR